MARTELSLYVDDVFGQGGLPEKPELPVVFVAPLGTEIPSDGVFEYATINTLSDIGKVKPRSVILWSNEQAKMLRVFGQNAELFGLSAQCLFGVPAAQYEPWFDDGAFGLPRVAYGAFVSELRAAAEVAEQLAQKGKSGTDIERDRYAKADGSVRFADIKAGSISKEASDDSELTE